MSNPIIASVGAIYVHEGVTVPIVPETDIAAGACYNDTAVEIAVV